MKKRIYSLFLSFFLAFSFNSFAYANYSSEYQNSAVILDIINATTAYDLGYTGSGVSVGVFDTTVRADHPEFSGRINVMPAYLANGYLFEPNWYESTHGTHVAGIIAASKNGIGMHGVAYNANLVTMTVFDDKNNVRQPILVNFEEYFRQNPSVRIVNSSWGSSYFPYIPDDLSAKDGTQILRKSEVSSVQSFILDMESISPLAYEMAKYALENKDKVFVFSASNDGMPTTPYEELLPRYLGSELSNWLSVGSLDSTQITKLPNGNLTLAPGAVSWFSNTAIGTERWTVFAPGSVITSTYSGNNGYIQSSGTSMAAPVVSGALALVQEKYPWMTGKQLVDTILSTANSSFTPPSHIIQLQYNTSLNRHDLVITYFTSPTPTPSRSEVKQLVKEHYDANPESWAGISLDELYQLIDSGNYATNTKSIENVFGQGILDVGKAMGGIAELDANRMTADNVMSISELGVQNALEILDTNGYDAELSNDISQFQWDDKYHYADYQTTGSLNTNAQALDGTNIGIIKTGAGRLILSGTNSYAGATIVEGGELTLATRADGSGGILQNSTALVRAGGTLSGNGTVSTNLINNGTVAPGMLGIIDFSSGALNVLNINTYTQNSNGVLRIKFDDSANNGKLNISDAASTVAGTLYFSPVVDFYKGSLSQNLSIYTNTIPSGAFSTTGIENITPTLDFNVTTLGVNNYNISMNRNADAYSRYAQNSTAHNLALALATIANNYAQNDMQTLLTTLDFSSPDGKDVAWGLNTLSAQSYDIIKQNSLNQQHFINSFVTQNLFFSTKYASNTMQTNLLSSRNNAPIVATSQTPFTLWGQILGSVTRQSSTQNLFGYDEVSAGIITGLDYSFNSGFTSGLHLSAMYSSTEINGNTAKNDALAFSLGFQGHFSPSIWKGIYGISQLRLGLTQNDMSRIVEINQYVRMNESSWQDFVASALVGVGKNWDFGKLSLGPLVWFEYSFIASPEVQEHGGLASSLSMQADYYNTLRFALGGNVGYSTFITESIGLDLSMFLLWNRQILDNPVTTSSSFVDYSGITFDSATNLFATNSYTLHARMRLNHKKRFFSLIDIGAELNNTDGYNIYGAFKLGFKF